MPAMNAATRATAQLSTVKAMVAPAPVRMIEPYPMRLSKSSFIPYDPLSIEERFVSRLSRTWLPISVHPTHRFAVPPPRSGEGCRPVRPFVRNSTVALDTDADAGRHPSPERGGGTPKSGLPDLGNS